MAPIFFSSSHPIQQLTVQNRTLNPLQLNTGANTSLAVEPSQSASTSTARSDNDLRITGSLGKTIATVEERFEISIGRLRKLKRARLIRDIGFEESPNWIERDGLWIFQNPGVMKSSVQLTVYPARNLARWMAEIPDSRLLNTIYIPGTHESLARYGYPISTCQSIDQLIPQQLASGHRFFDFRFSLIKGKLLGYHGVQNQKVTAVVALGWIYDFLGENPSECVIVSIKQENLTKGFDEAMWDLIDQNKHFWFQEEDRWPRIGEVRGKALLFSRFGREKKRGLVPSRWPNNNSKVWEAEVGGGKALVQDWYSIGSFYRIPDKATLALSMFRPQPPSNKSSSPSFPITLSPSSSTSVIAKSTTETSVLPWRLNFLSGATFLTAFPFVVAKGFGMSLFSLGTKGVNERMLDALLNYGVEEDKKDDDGGIVVLMDYYEVPGGLNELLISWNFV